MKNHFTKSICYLFVPLLFVIFTTHCKNQFEEIQEESTFQEEQSTSSIEFTVQPATASVAILGASVELSCAAEASGEQLEYQWY